MSVLSWLSSKADSPATRVISGIVSIGLVFSLAINIIPSTLTMWTLGFLAVHILNQLYFAFEEFTVHVCHRCGAVLKPITTTTYPNHTCKKKKSKNHSKNECNQNYVDK